jgi:hypothetical protein
MIRTQTVRKYWLGIVAFVLLVVAVILSVILPKNVVMWNNTIEAVVVSTGWVLFLLQYFYSKSERIYVRANSLRLWLTNEPTNWNFTVDLHNCAQERSLQSIWEVISQRGRQAIRWHQDDSSLIVNMPGYTIRAFTSGEASLDDNITNSEVVCIQVSDLELPFRTFRSRIENELIPLIRDISDTLKPGLEKYAAKISFSSPNPYFGFFVRRLDLPKVVSFTCDLIETSVAGRDQTVTVRKDRIEIVTDDVLALQALSLKYVALACN